ncbi:BESS motif [Popillia japonica]|uniref:BESS motif n=1 Tax=Popillia japonica TaxID=7064 RepID=A0AAW1HUF4_POPJA
MQQATPGSENVIWQDDSTSMKVFPFTKTECLLQPVPGSDPIHYFRHILTDNYLDEIIAQTNREYLHFILSYIKPQGQTSGNIPESQTGTISGASQASTEEESQHESEGVASIQESATEEVRSQSEPYTAASSNLTRSEPSKSEPYTAASSNLTRSEPSTPYGRRRKRAIPEVEKTFIDYLKTKTSRQAAQAVPENRHGSQTVDNPMQHFFMSLLPEFDTMTQDEIRAFKIKVLVLIDDIKSKRSVRAPDSAFSIVSCPTPLDSISSNSSATPSTFYQISHEFTHNYDTETPSPHSQEVNTIENLANNNDISEPTVNIHSYMHDFNTN